MDNLIISKMQDVGLKITPQRVAIFKAVYELKNHPSAENIIDYIKEKNPNISTATVYKVLDTLVENNLLIRVKTDKDIKRYDAVMSNHHHLYCAETARIEDYEDEELNTLLNAYFERKKIKHFKIEDIKLQITGKFKH